MPLAIRTYLRQADALLRPDAAEGARPRLRVVLPCIVVAGFIYGAAMGGYGGAGSPRPLQMLYSAIKVPMLLGVTFALTLPSFFVLYTLVGLRAQFGSAIRALGSAQASLALVLASLAPLTVLWYVSTTSYPAATLFNAVMFAVASLAAQGPLRRRYHALIQQDARHRLMLRAWIVIYSFVGIQMGWVLRPFIGDPDQPTSFFRADTWGNAYVVVAKMVWDLVTRHH